MLFDEPLTVIDPHLKWQLRRKLKQIHHELKLTLIYVTHDQVEALTFAEQVVVMTRGRTVQVGSADELFERPRHTFVGHFIGSPGMNFLAARWNGRGVEVAGHTLRTAADAKLLAAAGDFTLGVRPEYVSLADADDADRAAGRGDAAAGRRHLPAAERACRRTVAARAARSRPARAGVRASGCG